MTTSAMETGRVDRHLSSRPAGRVTGRDEILQPAGQGRNSSLKNVTGRDEILPLGGIFFTKPGLACVKCIIGGLWESN